MVAWPGGTGVHPFNLEVNGNDIIDSVDLTTIDVEMPGPGTNGSMRFGVTDATLAHTINEWDEVRLIDWGMNREVQFGGFVQSVIPTPWAGPGRSLTVECMGYGVLLDRKVVPTFPITITSDDGIGEQLMLLVNTFGGRVHCFGYRPGASTTYEGSATLTVFQHSDWVAGIPIDTGSVITNQLLRGAIEQWADLGTDASLPATPYNPSVGYIYWVDAYARFHAFWDKISVATGFDGDAPPSTVGEAVFDAHASTIEYEADGSDAATSVYVVGGNAAGSGFVRGPSKERAGDLEAFEDNSLSTNADLKQFYGGIRVVQGTETPIRGTLVIAETDPIDYRPGQKLFITNTNLGLSVQPVRITAVRMKYLTGTGRRQYTLTYGGRLGKPSQTRRLSRKQFTRPR